MESQYHLPQIEDKCKNKDNENTTLLNPSYCYLPRPLNLKLVLLKKRKRKVGE